MSLPKRQLTSVLMQLVTSWGSRSGMEEVNQVTLLQNTRHKVGSQPSCPLRAEAGQGAPSPSDALEEVAHGGSHQL